MTNAAITNPISHPGEQARAIVALGGARVAAALMTFIMVISRPATELLRITRESMTRRSDAAANHWQILFAAKGEGQRIINSLMVGVGAVRVVLLKTENGGGIPQFGHTLRSSVVLESYSAPAASVFDAWQNRLVDVDYGQLIGRMLADGGISVSFEQLKPDAILRGHFAANNVGRSHLSRLWQTPQQLFYLAVDFDSPADIDEANRERIRAAAGQLSGVLERASKAASKCKIRGGF